MEDIARLAHVSRSSVSIAVNGKPGISDEVRKRIFKVIDQTGYHVLRNRRKNDKRALARVRLLVVTSKNGMIGANYRSLPFFDNLVTGLADLCAKTDSSFKIEILNISQFDEKLNSIVSETPDIPTIILGSDMTSEQVQQMRNKITYTIFVDTYFPDLTADFVTMDNYKGAYNAAKYIISRGHTEIGYIASQVWISNFQERRRGFYAALHEKKIEITADNYITFSPTTLMPDHNEEIERLIDRKNRPTAIFCENDVMAVHLIKELQINGVNVPDEIAVMGFDDIPEGQLISPELTTIHVPIKQIVNQCVQQLAAQVAWKKWKPQTVLVSTDLVKRNSL